MRLRKDLSRDKKTSSGVSAFTEKADVNKQPKATHKSGAAKRARKKNKLKQNHTQSEQPPIEMFSGLAAPRLMAKNLKQSVPALNTAARQVADSETQEKEADFKRRVDEKYGIPSTVLETAASATDTKSSVSVGIDPADDVPSWRLSDFTSTATGIAADVNLLVDEKGEVEDKKPDRELKIPGLEELAQTIEDWRRDHLQNALGAIEEGDHETFQFLIGPNLYALRDEITSKHFAIKFKENEERLIDYFYDRADQMIGRYQSLLDIGKKLDLYRDGVIPESVDAAKRKQAEKVDHKKLLERERKLDLINQQSVKQQHAKLDAKQNKSSDDKQVMEQLQTTNAAMQERVKKLNASLVDFKDEVSIPKTKEQLKFEEMKRLYESLQDLFYSEYPTTTYIMEEGGASKKTIKPTDLKMDVVKEDIRLFEERCAQINEMLKRSGMPTLLKHRRMGNSEKICEDFVKYFEGEEKDFEGENKRISNELMTHLSDEINEIQHRMDVSDNLINQWYGEPVRKKYEAMLAAHLKTFTSLIDRFKRRGRYEDLDELRRTLRTHKTRSQEELRSEEKKLHADRRNIPQKTRAEIEGEYRQNYWAVALKIYGNDKTLARNSMDRLIASQIGFVRFDEVKVSESGNTLLHSAMRKRYDAKSVDGTVQPQGLMKIITTLISRGNSVYTCNANGQTAYEYALKLRAGTSIKAKGGAEQFNEVLDWPQLIELIKSITCPTQFSIKIQEVLVTCSQKNVAWVADWYWYHSIFYTKYLYTTERLNEVAKMTELLYIAQRDLSDTMLEEGIVALDKTASKEFWGGSELYQKLREIISNKHKLIILEHSAEVVAVFKSTAKMEQKQRALREKAAADAKEEQSERLEREREEREQAREKAREEREQAREKAREEREQARERELEERLEKRMLERMASQKVSQPASQSVLHIQPTVVASHATFTNVSLSIQNGSVSPSYFSSSATQYAESQRLFGQSKGGDHKTVPSAYMSKDTAIDSMAASGDTSTQPNSHLTSGVSGTSRTASRSPIRQG